MYKAKFKIKVTDINGKIYKITVHVAKKTYVDVEGFIKKAMDQKNFDIIFENNCIYEIAKWISYEILGCCRVDINNISYIVPGFQLGFYI